MVEAGEETVSGMLWCFTSTSVFQNDACDDCNGHRFLHAVERRRWLAQDKRGGSGC